MQEEMISIFLEESQEHLQALNDNLLLLEKDLSAIELIDDIFRSAHTFKGMAATMEFHQMANLTHAMENVLDEIRQEKINLTAEMIDTVFECVDILEKIISDIQQGGTGYFEVGHIVSKLEAVLHNAVPFRVQKCLTKMMKVTFAASVQLKSIRAIMCIDKVKEYGDILELSPSIEKIEGEEFECEFSIVFTLTEEKYIDELHKELANITDVEDVQIISGEKEIDVNRTKETAEPSLLANNIKQKSASVRGESKSIRVQLEKIEQLMNIFEESVVERGKIEEIAQHMKDKDLMEHLNRLGDISKEIQNNLLSMRMVPIETVFSRYPKMVRTLAKDLGKEIDLVILGEDTEVDKIVIDKINDPLVHLIRNAVDHGVETVAERKAVGKSETGTVRLEAFHSGNNVVIQISEDGRGINKEGVMKKAIKKNILSESDTLKLSEHEIYDLIFRPGFSTAEVVSDISGRGVGLDVVKTTITKLGGTLTVSSEEGNGSVFRIELPLTLSIIQAMLVRAGQTRYAIPLGNVVEAIKVDNEEIQIINGKEVLNYRNQVIEVITLGEVFDEDDDLGTTETLLLVVKNTKRMYGLAIHSVIARREIVLKSLGDFFADSSVYFSGATILGDGRVVLVLNPDAF